MVAVSCSAKLKVVLGPRLTEEQARAIYERGEEAVVFALLELAKHWAEVEARNASISSPATPSGMTPIHHKASVKKRGKKPGRKAGHPGSRRPPPEKITDRKEHRADCCPDCLSKLKKCSETRTRYIEDIPADLQPATTEHTIHRDWCPRCKKKVEPKIPDALPGSTIGNRTLVMSSWLHYGLGNTLSQIVEVFNHHLHFRVTPGGLTQQWYQLQAILYPWYEQLQAEALDSAVLNADETGWRVNGRGHWLWCFTTPRLTYYLIDQKRGRPVLARFFRKEFAGTLVTDFWGAYNAVVCGSRQTCLPHLLRDMEHVEKYKHPGANWRKFAKTLRRLLGDAMRLKRSADVSVEAHASRRDRLHQRLDELIAAKWKDSQARRLIKRLRRHRDHLLTFLDKADVPYDNNAGERAIRPAVIIRKNSYCNRSERGANTQAVLMSIYRTLKQRGHDPLKTITAALAEYITTNQLPPLPP